MATPIKSTPTLYGEDARRFIEMADNPRRASPEEIERIKESYRKIKEAAGEYEIHLTKGKTAHLIVPHDASQEDIKIILKKIKEIKILKCYK